MSPIESERFLGGAVWAARLPQDSLHDSGSATGDELSSERPTAPTAADLLHLRGLGASRCRCDNGNGGDGIGARQLCHGPNTRAGSGVVRVATWATTDESFHATPASNGGGKSAKSVAAFVRGNGLFPALCLEHRERRAGPISRIRRRSGQARGGQIAPHLTHPKESTHGERQAAQLGHHARR